MNFQLPKQDEDFDYYANSSQDESRGSQGRQFSLLEILCFACVFYFCFLFLNGLGFVLITLRVHLSLINHVHTRGLPSTIIFSVK